MSTVLITGASSGIGEECAKLFSKRGYDLLLVARNEKRLLEIKEKIKENNNIYCLAIDLTLNDGPQKVYEYCKKNNIEVSVLINNAGYGDFGEFLESDLDNYQKMITLNDIALVSLTHLFGKDMKERKSGHIINVASIAGFMPGPYMAVYYASKAFVLNFTIAINQEFKPYNIHTTTICPGPIRTPFWQRAGVSMNNFKDNHLARSPKQVANCILKAYDHKKVLVVDGFMNKVLVFFSKFISKKTLAKFTGSFQNSLTEK